MPLLIGFLARLMRIKLYNSCRLQGNFAAMELSLVRLPSERFKRNVVRGKLDLVGECSEFFYGGLRIETCVFSVHGWSDGLVPGR